MCAGGHARPPAPTAVVFDLGGVLIDWDPRYLYRELFAGDEPAMTRFLSDVCSPAWHLELDRGRDRDDAVSALVSRFPAHADMIRAYRDRWHSMFAGEIAGSVTLLRTLHARGITLYALSNYPREPVDFLYQRFDWMHLFECVVISGQLGLVKPDPSIYRHLLRTTGCAPAQCLFIDDRAENVRAAKALGMQAVRFRRPDTLGDELRRRGLPVSPP